MLPSSFVNKSAERKILWTWQVTLAGFRKAQFQVLVATDVAARGLDISGVELVLQTCAPKDHETYIHR